ncbi:MAG: heme ABC exporter ATP-binding protein CcmA [Acidimicrobiales bacterium]
MAPAVFFSEVVSVASRFPLLAGLSLDVSEGEVVHLRGPNGAGKTSLLRACAGLVPIVSGRAHVLGHDLGNDRISVRREVAHLGHKTFLYDDLTIEENLRFAARAARVPSSDLAGALERLELSGRLRKTTIGKLSAGQRRRVAIASVLVRRARLWLLDEPHAGLDEGGRATLDELIDEAVASGTTVLFASHELERARTIAHRVVEMRGGACVVAQDSSSQSLAASNGEAGLDVA